jgi:hypothetical protein
MSNIVKRMKMGIKGIINDFWFTCFTGNSKPPKYDYFNDSLWISLCEFLESNRNVQYCSSYAVHGNIGEFKWVGGVYARDRIVGIANGSQSCLNINLQDKTIQEIGDLEKGAFRWSGGCYLNNIVYGFPRSSTSLLVFPLDGVPSEHDLHLKYNGEHHYGGVCTLDGIVYQPPRNSNTILKINLNTKEVKEIVISNYKIFRYCGSIIHPNGLIYMLPEYKERVMIIDPKTDHIYFIGKPITSMVFSACVAEDGNIYGFSAYSRGILKIDVVNDCAEMLLKTEYFGCYGTVLGVNGKIIGIPGDGNKIIEYNINTNKAIVISELQERCPAKCAGSAVDSYGTIYCIPALGDKVYQIKPIQKVNIPDEILESSYINGNY